MQGSSSVMRLERLPTIEIGGLAVPVAVGVRARLLGLAGLDREEARPGLLIPRCASVHTFGMRFALDLVFLDGRHRPLARRRAVPPRRLVGHRGAAAVLELPAVAGSDKFAGRGGESVGASAG
jgi:uncharacterized membrane protein (UPF0127 family)